MRRPWFSQTGFDLSTAGDSVIVLIVGDRGTNPFDRAGNPPQTREPRPMAKDTLHIFERLRSGVVPHRGLDTFAVGIEKTRGEVQRQLDLAASGEGAFKFLRGGYGCGKTFMSRLALLDAHARDFAGSFVVVSDNDLHFHKFDDVYRKVMQELSTAYCERSALGDILDRWIGEVEESILNTGVDEEAPEFEDLVTKKLGEDLHSKTAGKVPHDMVRALTTIFKLKQQQKNHEAGALLSWLCGSQNVDAGVKRLAGLKGEIGSSDALNYLHGILEIIKAARYKGLVIVIDEAETILRMRRDVRGKSMNGIRQILDVSDQFKGLLWIFTGTPEFFDTNRGVAGLPPLHDRIQFQKSGQLVNLRQPQLELKPFDKERLRSVALRLREMYPASDRGLLERKIDLKIIDALVDSVSQGFKGDVGVVPRQFLRRVVNMFDLLEQEKEKYDPAQHEELQLNDDEARLAQGQPPYEEEPEDSQPYELVHF